MKNATGTIIVILVAVVALSSGMHGAEARQVRNWSNTTADDGSTHAMGNGKCVVYGRGPNISHFYGPSYSSPAILTLTTECDLPISDEAIREIGTAIWDHSIKSADGPILNFIEFVASDTPTYVRLVECKKEGVRWLIKSNQSSSFVPSASIPGAWVQVILEGQSIYRYPTSECYYHWVIPRGTCHAELNESGELVIKCMPGKGSVAIVGGGDYPTGVETAERVEKEGVERLLEPTREYWRKFTQRRLTARPLPKSINTETAAILDSVAVLIKAQQSETGGVMAGHHYALAYVRDQYGAARGMLALGMLEEARLNLEFRLYKFKRFGSLMTAEAMGSDGARHQHENDEVEGPGYTILQARDYIQATGDNAFGRKLWPMLEWCWKVQKKHLVKGLLPFSGDETYVAGGFFPRSGLIQGSADTTLVFVESGKWLCKWAVARKLWTADYASKQIKAAESSRAAYRKWFWGGDRVWANAPEREEMMTPPRFRHGVCEGGCGWFGWTERTTTGRYVCPDCFKTKPLPAAAPTRMEVNSVSLLPAYLRSDVLSHAEQRALIDHIVKQANQAGHIPSVPGTECCVGYDPGLVLENLVAAGSPDAKKAYDRLIRIADQTQAWCEYYNGKDAVYPGCCCCRPWESGVNAEAVILYAKSNETETRKATK